MLSALASARLISSGYPAVPGTVAAPAFTVSKEAVSTSALSPSLVAMTATSIPNVPDVALAEYGTLIIGAEA